jgi:hypothetical protein
MITKGTAQTKLIRDTWSFRGATALYYGVLLLRAIYPIFVWTFYLLTAVLIAGALASGRSRR